MSLIMACSQSSQTAGGMHGKTTTNRHGTGCAGSVAGYRGRNLGGSALRAGGAAAGNARRHAGGHGCCTRRRSRYCRQATSSLAAQADRAQRGAAEVGWSPPIFDERRRRARLLGALGKAVRRGWCAGCFAAARRAGPKARATRGCVGGISHAGTARVAQSGPGHPTPQERPTGAGGMEKNFPKRWQPC